MRTFVLGGIPATVVALTTVYAGEGTVSGYCGNGIVEASEICDDGSANGQPGHCSATCGVRRTPFEDPADAPTLQTLSFGRVLGTRNYEAVFAVGELPGVGLAPGFSVAIRMRSWGPAGACGAGCELLGSRVSQDGSDYLLADGGGPARRFVPEGASWRELPGDPALVFKPATASLNGGELVIAEPGGALTRRFDASGRESTRATPWGSLTLGYDAGGRLVSATNAAGATLTLSYDASGRLATVSDPAGFTTALRYAADGHLVSLDGPVDGQVTPSVSIGWSGNQITSVARLGFTPVLILYDGGLVSFARDIDGTAYAFDSTASQLRAMDSSNQLRTLTYEAGRLIDDQTTAGTKRSYVYDSIGRVTQVRDSTEGADRISTFTYDTGNRIVSATDPDGSVSVSAYDARGNLINAVDPAGRTTTYAYDAGDRMTSVTDPLGRTTALTYDGNGLVSSVTSGSITTSTTYTARGLVATSTDAFGATTTYGYDVGGRLTSVAHPGSPTVTLARQLSEGGEQLVVSRGAVSTTTVTDKYGRVVSRASSLGGAETITYDQVTGLPSGVQSMFRGATRTRQQSYTNTGDTAQVWENGVLRQWAARAVVPGTAWLPPTGDSGVPGGGGQSYGGMP